MIVQGRLLDLLPDPCYCCGAPATGSPGTFQQLRYDLCPNCRGAAFVITGKISGPFGWKGKHKTEKTRLLHCPLHGDRHHVEA
jgi:hypothetical protein